jgi:putative endonuclease
MYFVYIVRCKDNSLYCGQTKNVKKRIEEHNSSNSKGAKYTKGRRPVALVYQERYSSKSMALKREHMIKKLPKKEKESLIKGDV